MNYKRVFEKGKMERMMHERAKEMNTKIATIVRVAIAEYLNK